ncbi:aminoglycoside phosphotransferase family protein [Antribacter gilvus]|uniref:aminoglycoside phosphotransferase family protein n=1 Tax=Antribacter gilvus TaxID=2304675 RepID=UPI000F7996CE|nr:aminoglycoside phosphotransferase family protein [Antribacter gilvus]
MVAAELDVTVDLARALLAEQHPDLAGLPLDVVANGWDNVMLRLGDDLALRLPRRGVAAQLVVNEQRWLASLAPRLPVVVPAPVRVGAPSDALGYPWPWSVVPWVGGRRAADVPLGSRDGLAGPLARFVAALHVPAPADAPANPVRGVPLGTRTAAVRRRADQGLLPDAGRVLALWSHLVESPAWAGPAVWLHGDLHAGNVLVSDDGGLAAVVDFGDLTSGDPATDLATAWLVLGPAGRSAFRAALAALYPADDPVWLRARGWALTMSTSMFESGPENAWIRRMGEESLEQVLADA